MSNAEVAFGIVGLDGHGPVFTEAVNGSEPKVDGARVVVAMPVPSVMISPEKLAQNVEKTRALGVEITEEPEELAAKSDAILILHDDGSQHLELVRRFVCFGKPVFVDKPLEATAQKAHTLIELCRSNACPVFTASSLRFCPEIQGAVNRDAGGRIISAMTYAPFTQRPTMPGWIYYAVHAVEPLYALLGRGCREVRCVHSELGAVAVGVWEDGRLGIARASSEGLHDYGFAAWREKANEAATVDTARIYPALLARVRDFAATGNPPVDADESVEVIAFLEAANMSMAAGGEATPLARF